MKHEEKKGESGKAGSAILMWAIGIPIPIIILVLLLTHGCH